ncbi:MAG: hypothetical protein HC890_15225 [Chloroflexaceae bacterium]|nr:hypothetical protein [Chloroflexaceae bacterium]
MTVACSSTELVSADCGPFFLNLSKRFQVRAVTKVTIKSALTPGSSLANWQLNLPVGFIVGT